MGVASEHTLDREAVRNRLLRRVDWRFLLPDPHPALCVCFTHDVLYDALQRISDHVVPPTAAPEGACDLAVVVDPTPALLRDAFRCLRPGGSCYLELRGARANAARARAQLTAAGFGNVHTFWPWPSADRCYAWMPLDAPAIASAYFRREGQVPHGLVRRLIRRGRRGFALARQRAGQTRHVSAIARKPLASSPPDAADLVERVCARWADAGLGRAPTSPACVIQTGGPRSVSKVVMLVYGDAPHDPIAAVKISRVREAATGLAREYEALERVHAVRPHPLDGVPRVLLYAQRAEITTLAETALVGAPITGTIARREYDRVSTRATEWLIELALASRVEGAGWTTVSTQALAEFERTHGSAVDPALRRAIGGRFAGVSDLPTVIEQRDFSPWNVFLRADGGLAVLDWESAELHGVPGLDLIYFLSQLAFYRKGLLGSRFRRATVPQFRAAYREAWASGRAVGRLNANCLLRYAAAVGMDPVVLPALRALTWLIHSRSEYQRFESDHGGPPSPAVLRRGLFVNLLEEELARRPALASGTP